MSAVFVIVGLLIGFRPDENNRNISHPKPSGGDPKSAASEPLAEGAFGVPMKEIPLSNSPLRALVDDEDYEEFGRWKWKLSERGYVCRCKHQRLAIPEFVTLYLHKEVIGIGPGRIVDHKDRNKLNCQRENLRPATKSRNAQNSVGQQGTTSQFKGVSWHRLSQSWLAQIRKNGTGRYLGLFDDEQDAARAYNAAARRLFGEFARLNPV